MFLKSNFDIKDMSHVLEICQITSTEEFRGLYEIFFKYRWLISRPIELNSIGDSTWNIKIYIDEPIKFNMSNTVKRFEQELLDYAMRSLIFVQLYTNDKRRIDPSSR